MVTDKNSKPKNSGWADGQYLSIGISLGLCLGVAISLLTEQWAFLGAGLAIGVAIGVSLDEERKKKAVASEQKPEDPEVPGSAPGA